MIRHTQGDEESGRLELIGSAAVGRHAALVAGMLVAGLANFAVFVVLAAVPDRARAAGGGLDRVRRPGWLCCGLVFTAVAAVTAQVAQIGQVGQGARDRGAAGRVPAPGDRRLGQRDRAAAG